MPALESTESTGISIGGHFYAPAQVHEFLRLFGIVAGFILFSYLALVAFPKLASPWNTREPAPHRVPARPRPTPDISLPERPFAPRPPAPPALPKTKTRSSRPPAAVHRYRGRPYNPATSPPRRATTAPAADAPHAQHALAPAICAALAHLHRTADAIVGAHPAALPLALRARTSTPTGSVKAAVPWVHERTHDKFGLVQPTRGRSASGSSTANAKVLQPKRWRLSVSHTHKRTLSASKILSLGLNLAKAGKDGIGKENVNVRT
ncbi:hypothetical protein DFH07DRAFT_766953 [Mycena maculata]|uniref:Uncharacterized protein n=1 Tax=Mycena maculata TaxID=230809 RepID=A0AAD7K0T5_9AGAR|nr:hypothetical protein DFH07DRAFT_766953 [Mycena maculata]